jgi:hypothetical protein
MPGFSHKSSYKDIFIDLEDRFLSDDSANQTDRIIGICGIGGFPVQISDDNFFLLNNKLTQQFIQEELTRSLGMGAVLTHRNRSKLTNKELGEVCLQKGHFWTFGAMNVTVAFINVPIFCELSFSRDGRFHLSWVEEKISSNIRTFTASAPLKVWKKYLSYKDDDSFLATHRDLLSQTNNIFEEFYPAYFAS